MSEGQNKEEKKKPNIYAHVCVADNLLLDKRVRLVALLVIQEMSAKYADEIEKEIEGENA